ncbi:hypothetical protein [Erythrobacter cryptus]|uniref:hypothetical protein n=1 Tax=Erythrobacter cryptus TaxID=196588 RepID=UPI00316ACD50
MTEGFEELVIDVRARTEGFASDLETMRRSLDTSLLDGFGRAGDVLERGLLAAIRRGSLGFDDLKRIAFSALSEIAAYALQSGMASLFGKRCRRWRWWPRWPAWPDDWRTFRPARARHRRPGFTGPPDPRRRTRARGVRAHQRGPDRQSA